MGPLGDKFRVSLGAHLGPLWGPLWGRLVTNLGPVWGHIWDRSEHAFNGGLGTHLGPICEDTFGPGFEPFLERLWALWTRFLGSFGAVSVPPPCAKGPWFSPQCCRWKRGPREPREPPLRPRSGDTQPAAALGIPGNDSWHRLRSSCWDLALERKAGGRRRLGEKNKRTTQGRSPIKLCL